MWRPLLRILATALAGWVLGATAAPALAAAADPGAVALHGAAPVPLDAQARAWIDPRGDAGVEQVEAARDALPWQARRAGQSDRIDNQALWVQFDARVEEPFHWFLELGAAGIDRAQLFYRNRHGAWVVQESGDGRAVSAWPVPGRFPAFPLALEQGETRRYWLRVEQSRLAFAAPLTLYRETTLLAQRQREQFLLGAHFGISLLLALAALASGIAWRDRAFLVFSVFIVTVAGGQLARAGVGAQHLWPEWPGWNELAVLAWPGLPAAATLWLLRVVAEPARLSTWLDRLLQLLIVLLLAAVATDAVLRAHGSMFAVLVLTGLALAASVTVLAWAWADGRDREIRPIALAFAPFVLLALAPLARAFGLIPVSGLTRYAVFAGTLLATPLLYYALQARSMRRRESEVRAAALSHTDALTGLPHRRAFLERLETVLARARSQRHPCAILGVRVINLQQLASEFGRDVAEKAVVVAASHLRRAITDADLAARVGEDTFALLLDSHVSGDHAISRAQQVVASGLRPADALPPTAILRFAVTVGLLPHQELDAAATLRWALDDLGQITPEARKLIRPLNLFAAA